MRACSFPPQTGKGDASLFGGAGVLQIAHGKPVSAESEEPYAVSLQKHLLGYEFPDTVRWGRHRPFCRRLPPSMSPPTAPVARACPRPQILLLTTSVLYAHATAKKRACGGRR